MPFTRVLFAFAVPVVLAAATACAPTTTSSSGGHSPSVSVSPAGTPSAGTVSAGCRADKLQLRTPGRLTVATDSPAYPPWFSHNNPSNGKGYESAVAYAVAKKLGFARNQVAWVKETFNNSYAPGPKNFDFDINQISITAARAKAVDFSDGYYAAAQAVIALKGSPAASATSIANLAGDKLGAQTGTTSLTAIRDVIKPTSEPLVFDDTNVAKQALMNGQVDAILTDLPTAFYITAVQIPKGIIIGQFQPQTGQQEEFGMLFEQGSSLVPCVNEAISALKSTGELASIEKRWLSDVTNVPVLH